MTLVTTRMRVSLECNALSPLSGECTSLCGPNANNESLCKANKEMPVADKSTFSPDEWKTLLESVMATTLAVTAAEPSGLWGLLKESFATGKILAKAKIDTGSKGMSRVLLNF